MIEMCFVFPQSWFFLKGIMGKSRLVTLFSDFRTRHENACVKSKKKIEEGFQLVKKNASHLLKNKELFWNLGFVRSHNPGLEKERKYKTRKVRVAPEEPKKAPVLERIRFAAMPISPAEERFKHFVHMFVHAVIQSSLAADKKKRYAQMGSVIAFIVEELKKADTHSNDVYKKFLCHAHYACQELASSEMVNFLVFYISFFCEKIVL